MEKSAAESIRREENVILRMVNIDKSFPGVHALRQCSVALRKGEIHALVGENGAGKTTLMKVLTGIYHQDEGEIIYRGENVSFKTPRESQMAGISIVHQELNLMNHLTAAQNIFIGRESPNFFFDDADINKKAEELFRELDIKLKPTETVGRLSVGKQQMIEIAKAISFSSNILILDEPSAALTETEIEDLFAMMRQLKQKGVTMIYISHRLDEIFQIADRVTIMRDGEVVDTQNVADETMDDIINKMVGRVIYEKPKSHSSISEDAPVVLSARNLCSGIVRNVSFDLKKGEILGFAGLIGAGRTEVARLIFGADKMFGGTIEVNGSRVDIRSPRDAVKAGIGYLSEDRKRYGLAVGLSVADNCVLSCLDDFTKGGVVNDGKVGECVREYVTKINIKTPSLKMRVKNLSGGNQQKVVIAKWLIQNTDILIFDEPTRGIDVGAKNEIYKIMNMLSHSGKSIIMISSELPEILRMSDRVAVMCEGRLTKILNIEDCSQEIVMKYATQRR